MKYEDKLFVSTWRYKIRVGKMLIRFGSVNPNDVKEYLVSIFIGLIRLIMLPFSILHIVWAYRPKFFWYKGSNDELDEILQGVKDARSNSSVNAFVESFKNKL